MAAGGRFSAQISPAKEPSLFEVASSQAVQGHPAPINPLLGDKQLDYDLSSQWLLLTAYLVFFMQV